MNKKGSDFPSFIYAIAIIFTIGIVLFVISHLALEIYNDLATVFDNNPAISSSVANETLTTVIGFEQSMWDYFFLAIVFAYIISMIVLAFVTPSNAWVFAIFTILGGLGLFIGVALSNAWEQMVQSPVFASTLARFPITDLILNNFYPLFVTMMISLIMIMLFGKRFFGGGIEGGGMR